MRYCKKFEKYNFFLDGAAAVKKPKISASKIAMDLIKEKGVVGLYKGTAATALRDVVFSLIYFPMFANLNKLGPRKNDGSGTN